MQGRGPKNVAMRKNKGYSKRNTCSTSEVNQLADALLPYLLLASMPEDAVITACDSPGEEGTKRVRVEDPRTGIALTVKVSCVSEQG